MFLADFVNVSLCVGRHVPVCALTYLIACMEFCFCTGRAKHVKLKVRMQISTAIIVPLASIIKHG